MKKSTKTSNNDITPPKKAKNKSLVSKKNMIFCSSEQILAMHHQIAQFFEIEGEPISPAGVKDKTLFESACDRPNVSYGGVVKYKDFFDKLATLFYGLTKNHPFHNGNKRTAVVVLLNTLYYNKKRLKSTVTDDTLFDFVVSVTDDTLTTKHLHSPAHTDNAVAAVASWLRKNCEAADPSFGDMPIQNFLGACENQGATVKERKGAFLIRSKYGNIRIKTSTKKLSPPVVKEYVSTLGFNMLQNGLDTSDFKDQNNPLDREQIRHYLSTIKRLAKC